MLSARERGWYEGLAEGREEGEVKGANKLLELIKKGIDPDEAMRRLNYEKQYELAES